MQNGGGTYYYSNGDIYKGDWLNGRQHGDGNYIYATDKGVFKGTWKDGKKEGFGELVIDDKYGYSGTWH